MTSGDSSKEAVQALGDFFDEAPPPAATPAKKPVGGDLKLPSAVQSARPTIGAAAQAAAPATAAPAPAQAPARAPDPPPPAPVAPAQAAPPHAPPEPQAPPGSPAKAADTAADGVADGPDEAPVVMAPKPKPKRESPPPKQWRCKAGKTIFQEEESSFDLFILEDGKVEIVVADERVAIVDKPGTVLGEIGALLRRPRSAMVRALTPCTFTIYQDFEALMTHDPDKLLDVSRTLAQRLADTNQRVEKVFGILYAAKIKDEIIDNVGLALQGKKPKAHQKTFWEKLGL